MSSELTDKVCDDCGTLTRHVREFNKETGWKRITCQRCGKSEDRSSLNESIDWA